MKTPKCHSKNQGFSAGSCAVEAEGKRRLACQATLKYVNSEIYRLITSVHLSCPENYLSIYQSGCNFSCRKCHSWYFSKVKDGTWYSPGDILDAALTYEKTVTQFEPRSRATAWHAHDVCRCCGSCVTRQKPSAFCPGVLEPEKIVLSPQGFGPARNIVAFTGGDLTCNPDYYARVSERIKEHTNGKLWVLIETNGYALTRQNLEVLKASQVDSYWLDIKAYDNKVYKKLCGTSNATVLESVKHIVDLEFYNRELQCIVLVELKTEKFKADFVGQMNKYISYYRKNVQLPFEKDTIGLIICAEKGKEEVHYALYGLDDRIFVAEYKTKLPTEEEIKKRLKQV